MKKEVSKTDIRRCYERMRKLSSDHRDLSGKFNKMCEKYYGTSFVDVGNYGQFDDVIDTIDCGIGSVSFDEFDYKMKHREYNYSETP